MVKKVFILVVLGLFIYMGYNYYSYNGKSSNEVEKIVKKVEVEKPKQVEKPKKKVEKLKPALIIKNTKNLLFREKPNGKLLSKVKKGSSFKYISTDKIDGVDWYNLEYKGKKGVAHFAYFDLDKNMQPLKIKEKHRFKDKKIARIVNDDSAVYSKIGGKVIFRANANDVYFYVEKYNDDWSVLEYKKKKVYIKRKNITLIDKKDLLYKKAQYIPEQYLRKEISLDPSVASGFKPYSKKTNNSYKSINLSKYVHRTDLSICRGIRVYYRKKAISTSSY